MNYSQLVQAIKDYLETDETTFNNNIPIFVKNAEERILREVQLPVFAKTAYTTITANNRYLALPTDYLSTYSLATISTTNIYNFLVQVDVEAIREAYPDDSPGTVGTPAYYAIWDHDTIIFGPTTDTSYTFQMRYFRAPESIVTASTSWLGTNAQSVLLYGALLEAGAFLQHEQDVLQGYKLQYDEALSRLKTFGEGLSRADAYRELQRKTVVT